MIMIIYCMHICLAEIKIKHSDILFRLSLVTMGWNEMSKK